ncbi:MAG: tRNA 4-thiouridine(8) synthase ThiI, partial [Oscillospiraceae bacterium]|nr:tRNA 4-thiouridine(8) synthase ThiI [Oscillospiraceae bacterium]
MENVKEIILLKEGEIALKGLNRRTFEDAFIKNLRYRLKPLGKFNYTSSQSMIYAEPAEDGIDFDEAFSRASKVFGANAVCRAMIAEKGDFDKLCADALEYCSPELETARTFKVNAKRSDKRYPMKSPEICAELGGYIMEHCPWLSVDIHEPQVTVNIEIRDKNAYIHTGNKPAAGGIPVGTSGKALLMLSGGIDSPVAGYMMAKRGVKVSAIHYVSPPYTSDRARIKVERLCEKITPYCGDMEFYCVPFTRIQEAIRDNCPEELFTVIMRCLMIEIAQRIAEREGMQALITGESVGQVASQTMDALVCTDSFSRMPIFRPVIGMDKSEITITARKIDTFDISIEPYEDCCTVFTPKHPKTRPTAELIRQAIAAFDFEPLLAEATENTER